MGNKKQCGATKIVASKVRQKKVGGAASHDDCNHHILGGSARRPNRGTRLCHYNPSAGLRHGTKPCREPRTTEDATEAETCRTIEWRKTTRKSHLARGTTHLPTIAASNPLREWAPRRSVKQPVRTFVRRSVESKLHARSMKQRMPRQTLQSRSFASHHNITENSGS